MNYTNEIIVNQPIAKCIELFENPDNMKHWQPGFVSLETITVCQLPAEFRFRGLMRVMGLLMPGMFKKESQKYLDNFKAYAEAGKSVRV